MPDELDLLRSFRGDVPGPSTDAWARARSAITATSGDAPRRVGDRRYTRRRWPLTMGVLGAASGAAALLSLLVLGGSPSAFAGWSATPAYLTAGQAAATQDNCQASLATLGHGSWTQVATDVRGPYTMAVYESASTLATCFVGPSFTTTQAESLAYTQDKMMASTEGSTSPRPLQLLSGGDIQQLLVSHHSQATNGPYTLAEGRLEPMVSAVTLVLSDGHDITATTGSGWLVAWWPGSEDVTSAQITSPTGTTATPLNEVPRQTPSAPSSGSAGTGTAAPVGGGASGTQSNTGGGP